MHYGPEFVVVLVVCACLLFGAAMRVFAAWTRVPFTIAMLLLGIVAGWGVHYLTGDSPDPGGSSHHLGGMGVLGRIWHGASAVSPYLIIYVFLPALVFESAYALKVHAFKKNLGAVAILAVPALIIATGATAAMMVGLTSLAPHLHWGWAAALVFGALISATDPVAVVAILKETGAPKRLGVLIEGESLLNDGTAIVAFTVLLGLLTAAAGVGDHGAAAGHGPGGAERDAAHATHEGAGEINPFEIVLEFFWVVLGGIIVGIVLSFVLTSWIARTFNDPLTEITLTLVLAYSCMLVAEGLFHVSGVMAVVTAGLWMSATGKTRVSPEVEHFLHQFLEMLAYIANTLIFFLVGIVIAQTVDNAKPVDFLIVLAAYLGILVIRFVLTFTFRPVMNLVSQPVSVGEATVMAWGGLRGAVSLALALVVVSAPGVSEVLGQQMLGFTAGIVLLTILVNGSTTGRVLAMFGFDKAPLTDQMAQATARATVLDEVEKRIGEVAQSRDLRTVSWKDVSSDLSSRKAEVRLALDETRGALEKLPLTERARGYWRQALEVERRAYWKAYAQGTLGPRAAQILDHEVEVQLDALSADSIEPPESRTAELGGAGRLAGLKKRAGVGNLEFERLALLYDLWRAESLGADAVLKSLDEMREADETELEQLRGTYRRYARDGKTRLEDLRSNLPEVTQAIETRLAKRIQLNFEREGYEHLAHAGAIDEGTAGEAIASVQQSMKALQFGATRVDLPETAELCRESPLFRDLDDAAIAELAELTHERVLSPGDVLFKERDVGDSMYIIARGAVEVVITIDGTETVVDVLGGGDIIGEMSLLTGAPRTATIRAATTVTLGRIEKKAFEHLMETQPKLRERVWEAFGRAAFDNHLRDQPGFDHLDHDDRILWIRAGEAVVLGDHDVFEPGEAAFAFVVTGRLTTDDGATAAAPNMVMIDADQVYEASGETRVVRLPSFERVVQRDTAGASS